MNALRGTTLLCLAALLGLALTGQATLAGEKKIEMASEKGEFNATTAKDTVRTDCPSKLYSFKFVEGRTYTIELRSDDFDAYLRLEEPAGKVVAEDDDSGGGKT